MSGILRHQLPGRVLGTMVFEALIFSVCLTVFRVQPSGDGVWASWPGGLLVPCWVGAGLLGLWSCGLYSRPVIYRGRGLAWKLGGAFLLVSLFLLPFNSVIARQDPELLEACLRFHVLLLPSCFLLLAIGRLAATRLLDGAASLGNTVILGRRDESTGALIGEAGKHHGIAFRLVGVLVPGLEQNGPFIEGLPVLGSVHQIREVVKRFQVKTVIVNLPYDDPELPMDFLLEWKIAGNCALDGSQFYESISSKVLIERLEPPAILSAGVFQVPWWRRMQKEVCERMLAAVLSVALAPLFLLIAVLVRLGSPGPVIFRQRRVGRGGKLFTMYKFRTMVNDAEGASGPVWSSRNDPRVTAIGIALRRTHLDEMPQLFNILKGEMAFVGPRPERPEFVRDLEGEIECYRFRHLVKPGLTGWAQVSYPYAASLDEAREKLRYDLYYIKYVSLTFDWLILLATLRTTLGQVEAPPIANARTIPVTRILRNSLPPAEREDLVAIADGYRKADQ